MAAGSVPSLSVPGIASKQAVSAAGAYTGGVWGVGNQVTVFTARGPVACATPPPAAPAGTGLASVEWDVADVHVAKLVYESYSVFARLQDQSAETSGSSVRRADRSDVVRASRAYRSVLGAAVLGAANDESSDAVTLLRVTDLLWHLCHIFFVDTTTPMAPQLIHWLQSHFQSVVNVAEITASASPETHERFWPAIYRFVLQGRMAAARDLLSRHSGFHLGANRDSKLPGMLGGRQDVLKLLDVALSTMPTPTGTPDALTDWRSWHSDCVALLNQRQEISGNDDVATVFRILTGDRSTLKALSTTWYELLVAQVLFVTPGLGSYDVASHVQLVRRDMPPVPGDTVLGSALDQLVQAVMQYDVHRVLQLSHTHLKSAWFAAHMADLLQRAGKLDTETTSGVGGIDLRDEALQQHALALLTTQGLWQIAVRYLASAGSVGRSTIPLVLGRLPLQNDRKALKVLNVCRLHRLDDVAASVARAMARGKLAADNVGGALLWFMRANDTARVSQLAETLLTQYFQRGDARAVDSVLDNVGDDFQLSDKLAFLGQYRELCRAFTDGQLERAASLLVDALRSRLAPKRFWPVLLADAVPLLEARHAILIDVQDTYLLMQCLEDVCTSHRAKQYLRVLTPQQLQLVRLALTRNLSRAAAAALGAGVMV